MRMSVRARFERREKKSNIEFSGSVALVSRETDSSLAVILNEVAVLRNNNRTFVICVLLLRGLSTVFARGRMKGGALGLRAAKRFGPPGGVGCARPGIGDGRYDAGPGLGAARSDEHDDEKRNRRGSAIPWHSHRVEVSQTCRWCGCRGRCGRPIRTRR